MLSNVTLYNITMHTLILYTRIWEVIDLNLKRVIGYGDTLFVGFLIRHFRRMLEQCLETNVSLLPNPCTLAIYDYPNSLDPTCAFETASSSNLRVNQPVT
jgi:hypothetical protein